MITDRKKIAAIAIFALVISLFGVVYSSSFEENQLTEMINIYQIYNLTAWNATFINNSNISGTIIDFPIKEGSINNTGFISSGSELGGLQMGITDMPLEYNGSALVKTNDSSNQSIYTMHAGSVNTFVSNNGNYTCGGQFDRGYGFGFGTGCSQFIQIEAGTDAITGTAGEADLGGGFNLGGNRIYNSPDISYIWTTGVISGGNLTFYPGNATIHITEGLAMIRTGALQTDRLITVKFAAKDFIIVYGETKFIYLDFLSGVTELKETPSVLDIHGFAQIQVYQTFLNDEFHYIDARGQNLDSGNKIRSLLYDTNRFLHAPGGSMIGTPSGLNLSVTSGRFYYGLNSITHTALNTSSGDMIEYYYHNSTGSWFSTQNTTINNAYYNPNGSGLVALLPLKYKTEFVYLTLSSDNTTEINVIYGQNSYTTLADAEAATVPAEIPTELRDIGVLIGRIIVREGNPALLSVESAFTTQFTPSAVSDHNNLANIQGGSANEYYHLNASIYTSIITYMTNFTASVQSAMSSTISTKVNKSGDSLSGNLIFNDFMGIISKDVGGITSGFNVTALRAIMFQDGKYIQISPGGVSTNSNVDMSNKTLRIDMGGITMSDALYMINSPIPNGDRPYQLNITISNAVGTNNATNIFCNGHCKADFSDIRFFVDNTTSLSYWIENVTTGNVWVNVTTNGTVNMYYGNPNAPSLSNGNTTFRQFHDTTASDFSMGFIPVTNVSSIVTVKYTVGTGANYIFVAGNAPFGGNMIYLEINAGSTQFKPTSYKNGAFTQHTITGTVPTTNRYDLIVNTTSEKFYQDGVLIDTITTNIPLENMGLFLVGSATDSYTYGYVRNYSSPELTWGVWGSETPTNTQWCLRVGANGAMYTTRGVCI